MPFQKNNNKGDGHPTAPVGKGADGKLAGLASGIATGSLNAKATSGTEKKVGK